MSENLDASSVRVDNGKWPRFAIVCALAIAGTFLINLYRFHSNLPSDIPYLPLLVVASLVVLMGMAGLYVYAGRFYDDVFYLFIALGWVANAGYLFFEAFFPNLWSDLSFNLTVNSLSLLSSFLFYWASFLRVNQRPSVRRLVVSSLLWLLWLIGSYLAGKLLINRAWPNMPMESKFGVLVLGSIPFSVWALVQVGKCLRARLDPTVHGEWETIFPWTFYLYAGMQPLYVLKLVPNLYGWIITFFFVAFALKIINSVAALSIIRHDYLSMRQHYYVSQEQLKQRSVLEDIGVLASSIEHNIRTPLGVIDNELHRMSKQFQAQPDVLSHVVSIKEQKDQAFAATNIITVLRGDPKYFERFMLKVRLGDAFKSCIRSVKFDMAPNNIFFRLDERTVYVKAYRPLLEQAIINVLKNAVEAIREAHRASGTIDIEMSHMSKTNELVQVDITDNGCGIDEEDIPKLTTLYSTRGEKKPNSGIGLFITNRIMEIHGGRLSIQSEKEVGTTVSLFLPRA